MTTYDEYKGAITEAWITAIAGGYKPRRKRKEPADCTSTSSQLKDSTYRLNSITAHSSSQLTCMLCDKKLTARSKYEFLGDGFVCASCMRKEVGGVF